MYDWTKQGRAERLFQRNQQHAETTYMYFEPTIQRSKIIDEILTKYNHVTFAAFSMLDEQLKFRRSCVIVLKYNHTKMAG